MSLDPSNRSRKPPRRGRNKNGKTFVFGPESEFAANQAGVPQSQRVETRTPKQQAAAHAALPASHAAAPPPAADPQVLSRQRALRAAGYSVAVDGIWGPQSQAAWNSYVNGVRSHPNTGGPLSAGGRSAAQAAVDANRRAQRAAYVAQQTRKAQAQAHAAQLKARQLSATAQAEAKVQAQMRTVQSRVAKLHSIEPTDPALQRRLAVAKARLHSRPSLAPLQHKALEAQAVADELHRSVGFAEQAFAKPAAQMTPAELVATTVDPLTGNLDPSRPDSVKRVQEWLQAHGHPNVQVDGEWSKQTSAALMQTFTKLQTQERHRQVQEITQRFYGSHVIVPGQPLGPLLHAPAPGVLLSILQKGGFEADIIWREIEKRYRTSQTAFEHFQEQQLDALAGQVPLVFHNSISTLGAPARDKIAVLKQEAEFAAARKEMSPQQAALFAEQLDILAASRNSDDLKRRLTQLKLRLDADSAAAQQAAMSDRHNVHGFWGHTLHAFGYLAKPAHYTASAVEEVAVNDYRWATHPIRQWRDPNSGAETVRKWQEAHPWLEFGMEFVFDPLWLVKPLSIIGHGAEAITMTAARLERVGLAMEAGGRIARISAPLVSRPAQTVRAFQEAGVGVGHFARGETATGRLLQLDHFYTATRKLAQTKADATQAVIRRIRVQRRHNFRDFGTALWGGKVIDGQLRFQIDQSAPKVSAALQRLAPAVIRTLDEHDISLFSDLERKTDSIPGGQVRGYLTRQAEVAVHQNVAFFESRRIFVNTYYGRDIATAIEDAGMDPIAYWEINTGERLVEDAQEAALYKKVTFAIGAPEAAASREVALDASQQEFLRLLKQLNLRGFGGHSVELAERVKPMMDAVQQDIADTMALLQDHVEARAESKFAAAKEASVGVEGQAAQHPLWDAEGKWVGRGGVASRELLSEAESGFGRFIEIANHAFGRGHTQDEMMLLRQLELEAAHNSTVGTITRKAGEGLASGDAETYTTRKAQELADSWEQHSDGLYYDTRETLQAPAHYATHLRAAVERTPALKALLPELSDLLSLAHGPAVQSPFAGELGDLADTLARVRLPVGFNRAAAGAAWHDYILRGVSRGPDVSALGHEFQDAFISHTGLLDQVEKILTPRELVREHAYWAALSKAQSAPLRLAYKALSAFLDVWLIATLPLRPGFVVRNVIDNTAKSLADGAVDPRAYFVGANSIFKLGVEEMRDVLALGGRLQHNPAVYYLDRLIDSFWNHDSGVLTRIFGAHNVPVPEMALEKMRFAAEDAVDPNVVGWLRSTRNKLMRVMANVPENAAKRVLYRDTYYKAIKRGASEMEAFEEAIARIDFVLFDYSKASVLEDNLRFIFPFVQFWRKTATFWAVTAVKTPALPEQMDRFETTLRDKQNADLPEWMKRYVNLEPITHIFNRVPGLDWLWQNATSSLLDGMQTDPLNFFSFNVLYKTFKNENPDLPADHAGMKFIAPFVDALNDWGLSMNPLVRKPAEFAGVFNYRAWQSVFPETGLFDALSRSYFTNSPQGFNLEAILEDKVLGLVGYDLGARQRIEQNFDQWVQLEMAAQAERGEPVSREKAVAKIQHYYVVQTVLGFFAGMYARRRDDADIYLYNLQQQLLQDDTAFSNLSAKDQRAYELFKRRKLDPIAFDAYLEAQPQIEAYYRLNGTHEQREAFKSAHPDIIPYVSGWKSANVGGKNFVETLPLLADTNTAISMLQLVRDIDAAPEIKQAARQMFVTPRLQAFWDSNDTPQQVRDKMLQGELHAHVNRLQQAYFSIPESDRDARQSFLDANPMLGHYWTLNDSASDDLKGVMNAMNATLRDRYFQYLDSKDYGSARAFLYRFPFIFEFTSAEAKVNAEGDWISFGGSTGKTEHARDYLAAKQYLDQFFALMNTVDKSAAFAYLQKTPQLRAYFAKWGKNHGVNVHGLSQHAADYLAIKSTLQWFFNLLKSDKARAQAWLDSDSPEAKKVRDYLRRYANSKGMTQHGLDYAQVKDVMTRYFNLKDTGKKDQARSFLKAHPDLEAYFKKYGHFTKVARKWKDVPGSDDPAINTRLDFWKRYWTLEPDQRAAFVAAHADDAGVFVYGSLSARQREESQREYLRQAMAHKGMTKKMALYLRDKPLLDLYFTLTDSAEKDLFLRANPEVQSYLDAFGGSVDTGNEQLDKMVETYFQFDRYSSDRTAFLAAHPQLQAYFDRHSSPADLAVRELLDAYFKMRPGKQRSYFSAKHPEIQAYFDQRKRERDNELAQAMAFDMADPRIAPYLARAQAESGQSAIRVLQQLREGVARNKFKDGLSRRVDRTPTTE